MAVASFTADTATRTGTPERTVRRDAQRATSIPQIADTVGTSLDKGDELDALAKMPEAKQAEVIAKAKAGQKVSAKVEAKAAHADQITALHGRGTPGHPRTEEAARRSRAGVEALARVWEGAAATDEITRLKDEISDLKDTTSSLQNIINGLRRTNNHRALKRAQGRIEELEQELARAQAATGQKPSLPDVVYHDDLRRLWGLYMEEAFNKATYPNAQGFAVALLGGLDERRQRETDERDRLTERAKADQVAGDLNGKIH